MSNYDLTQSEADLLHRLEKLRVDDNKWSYPGMGGGISIPLKSRDGKERFILDIRRGRVHLAKGSYQNRARRTIILVRLCFGGSPHQNPDGKFVGSPHLHIYREGYGDKWAYPLPRIIFTDETDRLKTFEDFLDYCNIVDAPYIRWGLTI